MREALATAVLAQTAPAEERTRARLLDTLGRAAARYKDDEHLAIAADRLTMAARSYRSQGLWSWLAYTLAILGIWVHADRGRDRPGDRGHGRVPGGDPGPAGSSAR